MLDSTLTGKTPGFRVWLAKQHSNFCASRVQMKRWFGEKDDKCPSCQRADHLCRCPNEERTQLFTDCTDKLASWLDTNDNTHPELAYWIPKYIGCRGTVLFADLGPMSPAMMKVATSQDTIGWRNFMEGRVSKHIMLLQRRHLLESSSRLTTTSWMKQFISRVLHITHSQWLFRNFMLHDNNAGYLKLKERTSAAIQIDALSQVKPSAIPADSHFLLEFDTESLLRADSDTQHYWIAAMEAAVMAKASKPHPPLPSTRLPGRPGTHPAMSPQSFSKFARTSIGKPSRRTGSERTLQSPAAVALPHWYPPPQLLVDAVHPLQPPMRHLGRIKNENQIDTELDVTVCTEGACNPCFRHRPMMQCSCILPLEGGLAVE